MNNNNIKKKVHGYIKLPKDKYKFYDKYIEDNDLKKYFEKPIGLYDPYGENINPLTGEPYKNIHSGEKVTYDGGVLNKTSVPITYTNWAYIWTNIPLFSIVGDIINSIRENNITIIKAGTGVGKSFLGGRICSQAFNFQKKVIMTMPKKTLARKTAADTAKTCDVVVGEEVGYYFKGEYEVNKGGKESKIIFTTTGSLIRKLTGDDPYLKEYSCIIIDEAHERTVQTDELILFLKKALLVRKDLKIVFISATLNVEEFEKYFKGCSLNVVDMGESTSYEIKDYYEKKKPVDWQKTAVEKIMTILKSGQDGDILVFIKSGADANKMKQYLEPMIKGIGGLENPFMAVLESATSKDEQRFAIEEFNYKNHPDADPERPYTRKIVFATNVAESSLTVKGAVFVIDCGLALEDLYDPLRNSRALLEKFISQSAVKQRRGRVGRTKPGVCYHLYSEKEFEKFPKFPIPSIQKSDLTMDILDIMKIDYIKNFGDVKKLLNEMMNPPDKKFVDSALLNLYSMEAITGQENSSMLTDLGRAISSFSGVPIQLARAIIASYYYHCKYDVIPIVVIIGLLQGRIENLYLDYKPKRKVSDDEYKRESEAYKKNQHRFDSKYGDFLTVHNIYTEFRKFMKLPLEGGSLGNNNNNVVGNMVEDIPVLTRKTKNDAKYWCIENGIRPNIFVNMKDEKRWDKVGNESRKIDRTLMDIVQPAHLREKKFKDYKNDGGNLNKKEIKVEIKNNAVNAIDRIEENDFVEEDVDDVGKGGYLQFAGYNKRTYEMNFFPNSKMFNSKEDNILMAFAHGLYTNIAKNVNKMMYRACYPIEKSLCHPDNKSTISMKIKPAFLFYSELFMLREGQKDLKLNFITKFPNKILDVIKDKYKKYIEDCYKKESVKKESSKKKKFSKKKFSKKKKSVQKKFF